MRSVFVCRAKKEEVSRVRALVENAYKRDPRVARMKEEEKKEKQKKKLAKQASKRALEEVRDKSCAGTFTRLFAPFPLLLGLFVVLLTDQRRMIYTKTEGCSYQSKKRMMHP
jgi:hypothetical protein